MSNLKGALILHYLLMIPQVLFSSLGLRPELKSFGCEIETQVLCGYCQTCPDDRWGLGLVHVTLPFRDLMNPKASMKD